MTEPAAGVPDTAPTDGLRDVRSLDEVIAAARKACDRHEYVGPLTARRVIDELVAVRSECDRLREVERKHIELRDTVAAAWPGIHALMNVAWPAVAEAFGVDAETGAALAESGTAATTQTQEVPRG